MGAGLKSHRRLSEGIGLINQSGEGGVFAYVLLFHFVGRRIMVHNSLNHEETPVHVAADYLCLRRGDTQTNDDHHR